MTIKEAKEKFKLSWLRVGMSYHRFTNLREIFQGDLSKKLTEDVESKDFKKHNIYFTATPLTLYTVEGRDGRR